jgi:hypothetical protein
MAAFSYASVMMSFSVTLYVVMPLVAITPPQES